MSNQSQDAATYTLIVIDQEVTQTNWKLRCTQIWLTIHAFQATSFAIIGFKNHT